MAYYPTRTDASGTIALALAIAACSAGDTGKGFPDLPYCGTDPFVSVEVGYAALCATHTDGCLECSVLSAEWVEEAGEGTPPDRSLHGVSVSDGCDSSSDESGCSPQFGACALGEDGAPACWGWGYDDPEDSSPALTLASVSHGYRHACGVDDSGNVACWGQCLNESCETTAGNYTQVTSGHDFTCALAGDGSVSCWGYDPAAFGGMIDPWSANLAAWSQGPFVALDAVPGGPCGRDESGSVWCFTYDGGEVHGPYDAVGATSAWIALQDHNSSSEVAVCGLTAAGAVTCTDGVDAFPVGKLDASSFTVLSGSYDRLCGVTTDGEIVCAVIGETWAYCPFCTELFPDE